MFQAYVSFCKFLLLSFILSLGFEFDFVESVVFKGNPNMYEVKSENTPVCVFSRRKSDQLDETFMPPFLTFCSCTLLSSTTVITAKSCFVQLNWSVLIFNDTNITTAIDPKLRFTHSAEKFMILKIYDYERVTVATIGGNNSTKLRAQSSLDKIFHYIYSLNRNQSAKESQSDRIKPRQCLLFAYLSSGNQPNNKSTILTDVWTISEQLVAIPVRVTTYNGSKCQTKHKIDNLPLKAPKNLKSLLCISPKDILFDTCATDLGAPVFCNNQLTGLISAMINRPPDGVQNENTVVSPHIPNSCYTKLKGKHLKNYIYIAENLKDPKILHFTQKVAEFVQGQPRKGSGSQQILESWLILGFLILNFYNILIH